MNDTTKTKKIKKPNNNNAELWKKFDDEISCKNTIECVYRQDGQREFCDCCESILIITDEGFMACKNPSCGVIYKDMLDQSAEWRYYGADDNSNTDPTRCGLPINPLLKESSYGCKVMCPHSSSYEMRKIRRYTDWQSMPYKEKSQYEEFQKITILAQNAGLPKLIIDEAMVVHKKLSEAKTFRGCNRDGIIAATIYISCRINNYPRSAKEIATIFFLDHTSATKGCKNATTIINELEHTLSNNDKTSFSKTTPSSFIERYCSKLGINNELTKVCKFIALIIEKRDLIPENTPHSIAAGVVYYTAQLCNLNICKKKVSGVSEISEVTINKCYKKLEQLNIELIPKQILNKYNN
ncbi:transcription initiation factor TFIIIB [Chrysochromulina ericina virus CeV-01B]|jgi:transcription initiation factor TFIIB|uniref:Transcription initiation factor TFIIIB n=1 Tax=Chrysochromulina ericina virus CeV-01B TaxID=3070830 RepID=A0A0N9Q9D0_9VIRU|nr:transcription initiation factor TFIIIB [Chrysochromulina ericina virus]ALH23115.1 transcription initiation factor TFIIIB [Chrysochromulina ericina virus CeV-01B]|tara:strand:- start:11527 stop:12585 length:1059 start_codon:yes stop_codon:yes gene_type:complete